MIMHSAIKICKIKNSMNGSEKRKIAMKVALIKLNATYNK